VRLDKREILLGDEASLNELQSRVFPTAHLSDFPAVENPWWSDRLGNEARPVNNELSEMLGEAENLEEWESTLYAKIAEKKGVSVETVRLEFADALKEQRRQELRKPQLHRALMRRFLTRLDRMVDEVQRLEVLPFNWKELPQHLQNLISNAHEASLLGQTSTTAILCGVILEEALGERMCQKFELSEGIDEAVRKGLLMRPSVELTRARRIQSFRNEAVHNPGQFAKLRMFDETILDSTRSLLVHLFEKAA
jgi:hypothetical protein